MIWLELKPRRAASPTQLSSGDDGAGAQSRLWPEEVSRAKYADRDGIEASVTACLVRLYFAPSAMERANRRPTARKREMNGGGPQGEGHSAMFPSAGNENPDGAPLSFCAPPLAG